MEEKSIELIERMFEKGVLLNKELIENSSESLEREIIARIESEQDLIVLNQDYMEIIEMQSSLVDWYDIDKYRVDTEKKRDDDLYQNSLQQLKKSKLIVASQNAVQVQELDSLETQTEENESELSFSVSNELSKEDDFIQTQTEEIDSTITIVSLHKNIPKKYVVEDFANFFISRYKFIEGLLRTRRELQNTLSISRALQKSERENLSIIGIVESINQTKNDNLIITIEDLTGRIRVIVSKKNKELWQEAKDLVVDEIIGVEGAAADKAMFAQNIIWPDVPIENELKKAQKEEYVVFISDIHVGSKLFLKEEFSRFLKWINGDTGTEEQRKIAKKVKYLIIAGDLVDGIGIYPSQEEELEITDVKEQYDEFARLIKKVPRHVQMIACPGNHDVSHLAEPQSVFYKEFSSVLFEIPNLTLVSNPSMINIGKTEDFSGFDVLIYHGYSFDYYVSNVESIRTQGGYHRSDLIMKFLLKRRHLAPSFKSTPYYPAYLEDPLIIKKIPDIFITGHIHYSSVANYRGITTLSGSCWQAKTTFQEKLGHEPEPARVPVVNLKTREIKILRFG